VLYLGRFLFIFGHLDDVLCITGSSGFTLLFTNHLADTITAAGLLLSPKSILIPTQDITWLGKCINLARGHMRNTDATLVRCLGLSILATVTRLTAKRIQVLLGSLTWAFRPRPGLSLFTWSWYRRLWHRSFYTGFASRCMRAALFDIVAII
jgi:hypothetical protein